jgi:ABC-type glycerol-3-phosphate transport system substrate-binding protein
MKAFGRFGLVLAILTVFFSLSLGAAAAQDVVTVSMWVFEGESTFLPAVVESFEAANPGIHIEFTDIPEAEYVTKIDTALIAGAPPDIAFIYVPRWIKAGNVLPLDDSLQAQGINIADFNEGALGRDCIVEGVTYCIGTYTGAILLFYNKDLFDQAGLPYPSATEPITMDEYAAIAQTLSRNSDNLAERVWGADITPTYWWQDWRNLIGDDGRTIDGYINDESTIHAYEVIAQMIQNGSVMGSGEMTLIGTTASSDLMATGQLATSIIDNAVGIPILETAGIRWGAAVVPVEQAGDPAWTTTWTDAWGVFSQSQHADEAKRFIAFLATEGNRMQLELGNLPLNMQMAEEMNWAGDSEGRQEAFAATRLAGPNLFVPGYWDVIGPVDDGLYGMVMEDGMAVRDMLNELAPQMQETLDEAWATWDGIQ